MRWNDLENCFNRSVYLAFSKVKLLITFTVLVLCGILIVFCRGLAFNAGGWLAMSLTFLPILLSGGVLLSLGVLLIRIYHHEVKNIRWNYLKILQSSWQLILGTSYLAIPPILIYLLLWIVLGIFVLLQEIPAIGEAMAIILAFAPFLLIFAALLLCIINLLLLFFVSPAIALRPTRKFHLTKSLLTSLSENIFSKLVFFFFALFPLGLMVGLLSLSAVLTGLSFPEMQRSLSIVLKWFFIMLPFCAILTPGVVFFFNFAAECFNLFHKTATTDGEE